MTRKPQQTSSNQTQRRTGERLTEVEARIFALEASLDKFQKILEENVELTKQVVSDTSIIREMRSAFRLFDRIVSGVRYAIKFIVLPILAVLVAIYAYQHGTPHWWKALRDIP